MEKFFNLVEKCADKRPVSVVTGGPAYLWYLSVPNAVYLCVTGCISADPHLIQSSVNPASQGWLDSESPSPHGQVLQVSQSWWFLITVVIRRVFFKFCFKEPCLWFAISVSFWCHSANRNESRTVIRIKVLHILSFVLSTNRQLYEVCVITLGLTCKMVHDCEIHQLYYKCKHWQLRWKWVVKPKKYIFITITTAIFRGIELQIHPKPKVASKFEAAALFHRLKRNNQS